MTRFSDLFYLLTCILGLYAVVGGLAVVVMLWRLALVTG
jgi:hypothetical protein